ncbi:MAG: T9SS type A sorting domain-containing protein [Bacteroidota bacterium]
MKLLLPLLTFFVGSGLLAQQKLRVEPANVVKEVVVDDLDEDYQDITSVTVTNTSGRTIQLVQRTKAINAPGAWNYGIFSRRNQTAPYPMKQVDLDEGRPVRLGAGESASFVVVLEPDGISGEGTVEVQFSDLNVPGSTIATAAFSTKILRRPRVDATNPPALNSGNIQPVISNRPTPTTVRLYPNPDRGKNFFVEAPPGTKIGRVEVANTLGNRLRTFNNPPGTEGYDIKDLPDGLYLVFIYDKTGKKLKTLRLLHRRFGA